MLIATSRRGQAGLHEFRGAETGARDAVSVSPTALGRLTVPVSECRAEPVPVTAEPGE